MKPRNDKKLARQLLTTQERGGLRLGRHLRENARHFGLLFLYFGVLITICVFTGYPVACGVVSGLMFGILFCLYQQFRVVQRNWSFYQKVIDWCAVQKIAETETPSVPPVLEDVPPVMAPGKKGLIRSLVSFGMLIVSLISFWVAGIIILLLVLGLLIFAWFWREGQVHLTSTTDQFHVTVLSLDSRPGQFAERLRVECPGDMNAGLNVTDLKEVGIFPVQGAQGEGYFRQGNPDIMGATVPIHANGSSSTCEVFFRVTTTTNTLWHNEIGDDSVDTSYPKPLTVTQVRTNWPGIYSRDSALPLAKLGDYVILLSVR